MDDSSAQPPEASVGRADGPWEGAADSAPHAGSHSVDQLDSTVRPSREGGAGTLGASDAQSPRLRDGSFIPDASALADASSAHDAARDSGAAAPDAAPDAGPVAPPEVILIILTDDQRAGTTPVMPTVTDEIERPGLTFDNAYVTTPVCCPSRASTLSANYAHTHGVHFVSGQASTTFARSDKQTIATWLQEAGYRTGMFGKYLNGYWNQCDETTCYRPPGWNAWYAMIDTRYFDYSLAENDAIVHYGTDDSDYSTDVLRDQVLAFIDEHPEEKIFIYFAPYAPHAGGPSSGFMPVPAPRHRDTFADIPWWSSASYFERDMSDKPLWAQAIPLPTRLEEAYYQGHRRRALESLLAVDEAVAAFIAKLAEQGRLDDTAVLFTSDNGYSDGEHRWVGKTVLWQEQIRVPFALRLPPRYNIAPGRRSQLALNIDIAPTLVELAEGSLPVRVDGESLMPIILDPTAPGRSSALFERWPSPTSSTDFISVGLIRGTLKYILHSTGERELYDLDDDPFELDSFAADADPCILKSLEREMLSLGATVPLQDGGALGEGSADAGCDAP